MKSSIVTATLLLAGCASRGLTPDTGSFDWLSGCWQMQSGEALYQEMWLPPAPDGLLGAAREVRNGRTVFHEFSRIELRPGGAAAYIAQPAGQAPVEFPLVELAQGRLVFENLQHDYPTRIEYRFIDFNQMHARASGTVKGAARSDDYPMQRIECER
jgi:hypothetical protein